MRQEVKELIQVHVVHVSTLAKTIVCHYVKMTFKILSADPRDLLVLISEKMIFSAEKCNFISRSACSDTREDKFLLNS